MATAPRGSFSNANRHMQEEENLQLTSVGVDIGSSTSHLVFSRIVLERLDSRYVVSERETFYASDILLTPYSAENTIDATALGAFFRKEYADAKVDHVGAGLARSLRDIGGTRRYRAPRDESSSSSSRSLASRRSATMRSLIRPCSVSRSSPKSSSLSVQISVTWPERSLTITAPALMTANWSAAWRSGLICEPSTPDNSLLKRA